MIRDLLSRREVLGLIGAVAATPLLSCVRSQSADGPSPGSPCVVRPEQTEGPYFVNERLNRSDIRSDPATGSVVEGVPLALAFRVSKIDGSACTALEGATVDIWHTDALGVYSDVRDMGFDTRGKQFLRGYQATDAAGLARFTTIYPGWYPGRTVHIHFKIRAAGHDFTSQLYFPDSVTDRVYAKAPYSSRPARDTRNASDSIYRNGGSKSVLGLRQSGAGYVAALTMGVHRS